MGFMSKAAEEQGMKEINKVLDAVKPQDGKVHVMYVNLNAKFMNGGLALDEPNTNVMEALLEELQAHREIVDVKFSMSTSSVGNTRSVQILYK